MGVMGIFLIVGAVGFISALGFRVWGFVAAEKSKGRSR